MKKNTYAKLSVGLYMNYIVFGMVNIILASNMSFLTEALHTDKAGISLLVSAIGIGRMCTLYISGVLSDRFGRKIFVVCSGVLMAVFLIGIPFSPNYGVALALSFLAGVANSGLDSGTYPALIEAYPKSAGSATVLVRGVISVGAMLLPLMIVFLMDHNLFYGLSFFVPALIFLVNAVYLTKVKFPRMNAPEEPGGASPVAKELNDSGATGRSKPNFRLEGLCLIALGFTGPALLYIVQLWLPTFGQQALALSQASSLKLLSYYNIGSLLSVVVLVVVLRKWVKPVAVVLIYPCISCFAFLSLLLFDSHLAAILNAFIIGFSISGVLQLTLTVMSEFFSQRKGQITGFVYTATSLSYTLIPMFTGQLQKHINVSSVFLFAIVINLIGVGLAVIVNVRYSKVFPRVAPETAPAASPVTQAAEA